MSVLKLPGLSKPVIVELIACAEGHGNYTWLYITHQPKYLATVTLKRIEAQLPGFIRVHKSSLINPMHVAQVKFDGYRHMTIHMTNGIIVLVARRRIEQVRQQLRELA